MSSIAKRGKTAKRSSRLITKKDLPIAVDHTPVEVVPGIYEQKWEDMIEDEERDLIGMDMVNHILEQATKIIYKKYMEKQAVYYTVHCLHLAWLKIINWYFFPHPPPPKFDTRDCSWLDDKEPDPVPLDPWANNLIPTVPDKESEDIKQKCETSAEEKDSDDTVESSEDTLKQSEGKLSEDELNVTYMLRSLSDLVTSTSKLEILDRIKISKEKIAELLQEDTLLPEESFKLEEKLSFFSRMKLAPIEELATVDPTRQMTLRDALNKKISVMEGMFISDEVDEPHELDATHFPPER